MPGKHGETAEGLLLRVLHDRACPQPASAHSLLQIALHHGFSEYAVHATLRALQLRRQVSRHQRFGLDFWTAPLPARILAQMQVPGLS